MCITGGLERVYPGLYTSPGVIREYGKIVYGDDYIGIIFPYSVLTTSKTNNAFFLEPFRLWRWLMPQHCGSCLFFQCKAYTFSVGNSGMYQSRN